MEPTTFGRYELVSLLAEGERTEVWLARQGGSTGFEKLVVLRRLHRKLGSDSEVLDRFFDEARINALLHHPNILSVFELGDVEGRYFLVTEYVEGMTLESLVHRTNELRVELPLGVAVGLVGQAARGVHHAHEQRAPDGSALDIVHRDLAPRNLLIGYDGTLKLADFGAAQASGRRAHTTSGTLRGTPTYMSPEQVTGSHVDRRSDVFGLGILLWELLTQQRLFAKPTSEQIYDAITAGDVPPPSVVRPDVPVALDAIVARAMSSRPEDRYPTAQAFAEALWTWAQQARVDTDVRAFLGAHFSGDLREQEELARAMTTQQELVAPTFDSLPMQVPGPEDPSEFLDGNTERDRKIVLPADAAPSSRRGWIVVLVIAATILALVIGILAGHAHH
ncbi:MAG: serine/threonine-protein kinase [Polyangia bacterium]